MLNRSWFASLAAVCLTMLVSANGAQAQIAYGVNAAGTLFRFDVDAPAAVTPIGSVGFVPEGIDFRPGTSTLYAIDIGPNTSQLYTIDINSAAPTAVGAGFTSSGVVNGVNYTLGGPNQTYGFDFNPTTLQPDTSMRIRLVSTSNANLRLNSSTGQIFAVDGNLTFANGNSPFIDASAYINNNPTSGGTTQLFDIDSRNDSLVLQNPPNNGTVEEIGKLGVTVDASRNVHFDIYTIPGNADATIGGDSGYVVLQRPDAPINGPLGAYLLYDINLATGQITNGALVGPAATPYDFTGGFAVLPVAVPEPASLTLVGVMGLALASRLRRR